MAVLEGIEIKNYRALRHVTLGKLDSGKKSLSLPRVLAVIGANGTGKSTLLDAIEFLGDCLASGVEAACDQSHRGGFARLRTRGSPEPICFEVRYRQRQDSRPISYTLHIDADASGRAQVVFERLRQARPTAQFGRLTPFLTLTDGAGEVWSGEAEGEQDGRERLPVRMSDRQVLGISTLGTLVEHPRIAAFREFLSGWYLSYFVPELARVQPSAGVDTHLDRSGGNLAKYLQYIQRERPDAFSAMLERVARKVPGIQRIEPDETADGRLLLKFWSQGYERPFFQQDMSDGTLKLLAYMLLMEDPAPHPLIGIEEPENGLHHQLLTTLAAEFQSFANRQDGPQMLITTHSPQFVDALSPDQVWLLEKGRDGYSRAHCVADLPDVRELSNVGLQTGNLWFSNHFGSLPG
jgi:predicted ATPase